MRFKSYGSYEVAPSHEYFIIYIHPLNLVDRLSSGKSMVMQDE
jgi:hypothetical protein